MLAERMFLRLVQFGDGDNAPVTRRQQTFDRFRAIATTQRFFSERFGHLIDNRLLVSDDDDDPSVISGKGQYVTISHEMLLIKWPAAEAWIKQGRQDELFRRELVRDALAWKNCVPPTKSHEFLVYQGNRLERLLNWAKLHPNDINVLEDSFLAANVNKQRYQRRNRTLTFTTIGLLIAAAASIGGLAAFDAITRENNARALREMQENLRQQAVTENPFVDSAGGVQREEVSFEQYARCSQAQPTLCPPLPIEVIDPQLPITGIDPYQASAYCRWIGGTLPTVQQWLQAAIGYGTVNQRAWPWDDTPLPDSTRVNARTDLEPDFQPTGPVATNSSEFSAGDTPEGLHHLFGNVREWTRTIFEEGTSPVSADASVWNGIDPLTSDLKLRAVGYSWQTLIYTSLTDQFGFPRELVGEFGTSPDGLPDIGFRCVRADVGQSFGP
ncbi:MAG: SUMF1/EgtB/PvdO family nonheme iron enzyme [Anaerolineae bacterium]